MALKYTIEWPLDLFISKPEMLAYGSLFSFLSSLRKTHTRVQECWTSLSNAQRARRKWTGLSEGGTEEDSIMRKNLLRRGWGIVRDMGWFLDTLLGYVMMDVVDNEFRKLKSTLSKEGISAELPDHHSGIQPSKSSYLDFTSIRTIHFNYLDRLLNGCLLTNASLTTLLESILGTCEQFVAQIERWGGDVLPALLFEGSLRPGEAGVGDMVKQRWSTVAEIDQTLRHLFESFYEQLNSSISQQPLSTGFDTSTSIFVGKSMVNHSTVNLSRMKGLDKNMEDSRRHIERLLLRLDFNGGLSKPRSEGTADILKEGGL